MKKIIFTFTLAVVAMCASAQGQMDALRFYQSDIMGTARYMGMGGAFNALGGDATAISKNPAGLGVFRKSELSFTTNMYINKSLMETSSSTISNTRANFNFNNFALVASFLNENKSSGLIASNFAITYDRMKNFHSKRNMTTGFASPSILHHIYNGNPTWDLRHVADELYLDDIFFDETFTSLDNGMSIREKGTLGEWNFSYGANISNMLYLGASLGIRTFDYSMESAFFEDYYDNKGKFMGSFDMKNLWSTTATGFNLKLGAIVRPLDFLRIGVSIQTPTFYTAEESFSMNGNSTYYDIDGQRFDEFIDGADGRWYNGWWGYDMTTPFILNTGVAAVLGTKGMISVDYELKNYALIDFDGIEFSTQNQYISNDFKASHALRVGGEYRINNAFSARLGYSFVTSPVKASVEKDNLEIFTVGTVTHYTIPKNNSYYTAGFGYRARFFFFDIAYIFNAKKDNFYPFNGANVVTSKSRIHNIATTFGWRF